MITKPKLILTLAVVLLLAVAGVKLATLNNQTAKSKINLAQAAQTFIPDPNSPLGKGEHPRLHITKATLPEIKTKIQTYYLAEYQKYITWADSVFDTASGKYGYMDNVFTDINAFAFIGLMGDIHGITYQHTPEQFAQRSIEILLNRASVNADLDYPSVMAYDWSYNVMTFDERATIVNWMIHAHMSSSSYKNDIASGGPWSTSGYYSSQYFETYMQPFYAGLAFYGDDIADNVAQTAVDSFDYLMLNGGFLDCQNFVADGEGGYSEWIAYAVNDNRVTHPLLIDGWRTATGEDYFVTDTSLTKASDARYWPILIAYNIKPWAKGGNQWIYIKIGQTDAGWGVPTTYPPYIIPSPLKSTDPDMISLDNWLIKNRIGGYPVSYGWQKIMLFLFGAPDVSAKSPSQIGLPLTKWFKGMGEVVMRTGFEDLNDTAITVEAGRWNYPGHGGPDDTPGFTVDKYGPLVLLREAYKRGAITKGNYLYFEDPINPGNDGFRTDARPSDNSKMTVFVPDSKYDRGGVQTVESVEGEYDYVDVDYTRYYATPQTPSNRVEYHTRQFVYFRPESNLNSDYVVIFDRAKSKKIEVVKKWLLHMGFDPQVNGVEYVGKRVDAGEYEYRYREYNDADQMTITNVNSMYPDAHGRLFIKTLAPDKVKIAAEYPVLTDPADLSRTKKWGDFYVGTWETQTIPQTQQLEDNFLHVMQTADSNITNTMTQTSRIDGDTMVGAYIQDDVQGHKVAMFSKTEANQTQVTYTIPETTKTIKHLIADLATGFTYNIYQDANKIDEKQPSQAGTLYFTSQGASVFQITQGSANLPPTISSLTATPQSGNAPLIVSFTSTATDPDGSIASYSWDFGDSQTSTEQNTIHTYITSGTYTATLTVTDNNGAKASDSLNITVGEPADTTPPSAITDLSAQSGTNPGEVNLIWTAPGDDGDIGTASAYIIKYAQVSIDDSNWDIATAVANPPVPQVAGTQEIFTVSGLTPGATYYFAIKAQDEVPNLSDISNSPSAQAKAVPNITLTKSADKIEVQSGDIITYTIAYQNIGTGDATKVIITDPIPAGTRYVAGSADATGGKCDADPCAFLTWDIGEVKAGSSGSVGFEARVE